MWLDIVQHTPCKVSLFEKPDDENAARLFRTVALSICCSQRHGRILVAVPILVLVRRAFSAYMRQLLQLQYHYA